MDRIVNSFIGYVNWESRGLVTTLCTAGSICVNGKPAQLFVFIADVETKTSLMDMDMGSNEQSSSVVL